MAPKTDSPPPLPRYALLYSDGHFLCGGSILAYMSGTPLPVVVKAVRKKSKGYEVVVVYSEDSASFRAGRKLYLPSPTVENNVMDPLCSFAAETLWG